MFHTKEQKKKLYECHGGVGHLILKTSDNELTEWSVYCHKGELRSTGTGKPIQITYQDDDGETFHATTDIHREVVEAAIAVAGGSFSLLSTRGYYVGRAEYERLQKAVAALLTPSSPLGGAR